jgi:hypothetical protein
MTREEFTDFVEQAERFGGALFVQSDRHLQDGEDVEAGLLLALQARIAITLRHWRRAVTPAEGWAEAAPAAPAPEPAAKCRHVFTGPGGDVPERCSKCGAEKRANGRPRSAPASQAVLPPVAK